MMDNGLIIRRKDELLKESKVILDAIRQIADEDASDPWRDPKTLTNAIKMGILDAPHLKGSKFAKGEVTTKMINGACYTIDPETNDILTEEARIAQILL